MPTLSLLFYAFFFLLLLLLFLCVCFFEICIKLFPKTADRIGDTRTVFSCIFFLYLFYDSSSANVRICTQASKQDVNNTQKEAENCQLFSAILLLLYPP